LPVVAAWWQLFGPLMEVVLIGVDTRTASISGNLLRRQVKSEMTRYVLDGLMTMSVRIKRDTEMSYQFTNPFHL